MTESKNTVAPVTLGVATAAALGAAIYVAPTTTFMAIGGAVAGGLIGGAVGGGVIGTLAATTYTLKDAYDRRNDRVNTFMTHIDHTGEDMQNKCGWAGVAVGMLAGASLGGYYGHAATSQRSANSAAPTEQTTKKAVGFSQTLQEAADEFRGRTG